MPISFAAAAAATLVALVLTGLLVQRCARVPRLELGALACVGLGVTVALAAQTIGYERGFGATTFRAVHLGAQLLAPMALAWALAEMTGKSLGSRFAARLALGGLTIVAAVVLASDPLGTTAFTKSWPAASVYYQLIPNGMLELVAVVTALAAVMAVAVAAVRARRYPGWHQLFGAVAAAAVAALAADGLRVTLPVNSAYPAICLLIVALAWLAGRLSSRIRLDVLRLGGPVWNEDTGEFVRYNEDTGEFAPYRDDDTYRHSMPANGAYAEGGDPSYTGWFGDEPGDVEPEGADADFSGWFREGAGGAPQDAGTPARGGDGPDSDFRLSPAASSSNGHAAAFTTGDILPSADTYRPAVDTYRPADAADARYQAVDAGYPAVEGYQAVEAGYPAVEAGYQAVDAGYPAVEAGYPAVEAGYQLAGAQLAGAVPASVDTSRLFGQIAIYTLLDGRVDDFDSLAERVVEQVRGEEPGTLVYVMHAVPSAPMQRILYEVYRDEAAYEEHVRQPYVQRFEEERKPCVLATNVIELGVRHAKFAPAAVPSERPLRGDARPWGSGTR